MDSKIGKKSDFRECIADFLLDLCLGCQCMICRSVGDEHFCVGAISMTFLRAVVAELDTLVAL